MQHGNHTLIFNYYSIFHDLIQTYSSLYYLSLYYLLKRQHGSNQVAFYLNQSIIQSRQNGFKSRGTMEH